MPDAAVEVVDLVKRYGRTTAVGGLSFQARRGQVTALLGPNGAGKTSTVETCEGFRAADGGGVRVLGLDPHRDHRRLAPRVGVMLQAGGGYPGARAGELLELLASFAADPLPPADLLDRLGLTAVARTPYRRLSGGERQRLSLAMALVGRPELVFLDEPTAGLDPQARRATWELVRTLRTDGVSVLLTTHYLEEAEQLADRVVIIDHGRLVADGSPAELTGATARRRLRLRSRPGLDVGALRATLPAGTETAEPAPGSYLVGGDIQPGLVGAVVAWFAAQDALVVDLQVGERRLEDVFLELTGSGE